MPQQEDTSVRYDIYKVAVADLDELVQNCPQYDTVSQCILNRVIPQIIDPISVTSPITDIQLATPVNYRRTMWQDLIRLERPDEDYALIVDIIGKAKDEFPRNAWARCLHARAIWSYDRYEEALQELLKAAQLERVPPLVYALLGETYYLLGRYHEALTVLNRAISEAPMGRSYSCRAYTCKALAEDDTQGSREIRMVNADCAIRDFERATVSSPGRRALYRSEITKLRLLMARL